jgi:hypothetical protein
MTFKMSLDIIIKWQQEKAEKVEKEVKEVRVGKLASPKSQHSLNLLEQAYNSQLEESIDSSKAESQPRTELVQLPQSILLQYLNT